jgi:hypothetical protein
LTPQPQPRGLVPVRPPARSAAETLRGLALAGRGEHITIDEILGALGNNSFGLLVLVLALPNAIPVPMIPGFSVPFALGIILLCAQILGGNARPLLPGWLRRRAVRRERFRRFIERADPVLDRFERWFKPRTLPFMHGRGASRRLAAMLILFALVLALPIPLGNGPEAFAICVIGLGLFASDERVQTIGVAGGVAATLLNAAIVIAGLQIVHHAARHLG